jgi:hypothetical protein
VTLHNRWSFVDATEVADRRCLVRLWLAGEPDNPTAPLPRRRSAVCARRADLHTGALALGR